MDKARWEVLKRLFGDALDQPDELPRLLEEAERFGPGLSQELLSLLQEHAIIELRTGSFLSQALAETPTSQLSEGGLVGPYRLLGQLGRGGDGVVFLAERVDDEFNRPVALKVLFDRARDQSSPNLQLVERQALSRLQHPHIAALIDWSGPEDARSWLAMEYVRGQPIDEYCETRKLGLSEVLDVFEQVCEAVRHAHSQLLVHRDLKPSNILVTGEGVVKLLDFGIAKRLFDPSLTQPDARRFTPAYASPEQIAGEPVAVTTDVYALGLLLYRLLSGSLPVGSDSIVDLARRTEDRGPSPPSARRAQHYLPSGKIPADLDRVVLCALQRNPDRRYLSVDRFLADIQRVRTGYPIEARAPSALYRTIRFLRRNPFSVAMALVAVLGLLGGVAGALVQAREALREQQIAERRFDEVRSLARWVIFDAHDALRRLPGTVRIRRDLIAKATEYLDRLNAEHPENDSLLREIAQAYIRAGYGLGGLTGTNLGNTGEARRSYRTALQILDGLWERHPGDQPIGTARFAAAYNLSMMTNDPAEGAALASRYLIESEAWADEDSSAAPLMAVELLYAALGRTQRALGMWDASLASFERSIAASRRALPMTVMDGTPRPMFGTVVERSQNHFDTGLAQFARTETLLEAGRPVDAVSSVEEAAASFLQSRALGPGGPSDDRMYARVHGLLTRALLQAGGEERTARAWGTAAVEMEAARRNAADGNATSQRDLAEAYRNQSALQARRGRAEAARSELESAIEIMEGLVRTDSAFLVNRFLLAAMCNDLGALVSGPESAAAFERARELADQGLAEAPGWVGLRHEWARSLGGLKADAVLMTPFGG